KVFSEVKPTLVFHCAAYTAVDKAEDEGKALDYAINVTGTENIAKATATHGATLVYISSDYVFDGEKTVGETWSEDEQTNPQTEYGRTKVIAEQKIQETLKHFYLIRTSWLFGKYGKNFVSTMLDLADKKEKIEVVNDQHGCPTWSRTLAEFILYLIEFEKPFGIYHLSNLGPTTWYGFAKEILKNKPVEVIPVNSEAFLQKAKRPKNSVLSLRKAQSIGFNIPTWQDALKEMLK
ncbi:MAG: dTDP-4-dehydrorhamnose reductase, partial [Pseudolactococcus raffinolactis]